MNIRLLPLKDNKAESFVIKWLIAFFLIALILHVWRIFTLNATYDQGLFLQEIWNGLYGRPFESTLASELSSPVFLDGGLPQVGYKHLGQHFTPLLVFWIPFVGILGLWSLPLIQVGLITISSWLLFLLAKEYLPPKLSAWITCSFLVSAPVIGPSLENFHDLCMVPLLVFSILLAIARDNKSIYLLAAFLLPLVREDVGLIAFGIGLWIVIRNNIFVWKALGIGLCLYSVIYVLIVTNSIMPIFGSELSRRFMHERFGQYLQGEDGGTLDVLIAMLRQPGLVVRELFSPPISTFRFLITLALPLAIIPWLSIDSWLLIALPLFIALSSSGGNAMSVSLRFMLYLVPGIFAGTVFWWKKHLILFNNKSFQKFWKTCMLIAFIFAIAGNPHRSLSSIIPDSVDPWVYVPIQQSFKRGIQARRLISFLPKDSSIAADTQLIPQLAQRRLLMRFPENYQYRNIDNETLDVEYIVSQPRYHLKYAPAFNREKHWTVKSINQMEDLVKTNKYGVSYCDQTGVILKKGSSSSVTLSDCLSEEILNAREFIKQIK